MAQVTFSNVKKRFGAVQVVHGIEAQVEHGEFLVIVGPSGCGKSTLLRMVAGLETLSDGKIIIDGRVVNGLEPRERNVAMVFQNYALYPHMSVYDNMAYGLKVRRERKSEIEKRVQEAAHILGLEALLKRKPRELSGGQRQRVAMGRAIVREPAVFLFDEPLSNLDAKLRTQMRVELKRLHQRIGNTSIYVTHDQVEAMTLADRIMIMNAGRVEQMGTPDEVYNHPGSTFVAQFMGSPAMNMLPAVLQDEILRVNHSLTVRLAESAAGDAREVVIGIRPEHMDLASSNGALALETRVDLVEPLGSDTLAHCYVGEMDEPLVARLPGDAHVQTDTELTLYIAPERVHVFDMVDGRRLDLKAVA